MAAHTRNSNPFDFMALLIQRLKALDQKCYSNKEERDSLVFSGEQEKAVAQFLQDHPILTEEKALLAYAVGVPPSVLKDFKDWPFRNEFVCVFHLLCSIDRCMGWEAILHSHYITDSQGEGAATPYITALNQNAEETGCRIIPRVPTIHDSTAPAEEGGPAGPEKHWGSEWDVGINQELKNTYYTEAGDLFVRGEPFQVRHVFFPDLSMEGKASLRVGLSPVLCDEPLNPHYYEENVGGLNRKRFSVLGLTEENRVRSRIEASLYEAGKNDVDVMLFPEMLGNRSMLTPENGYSAVLEAAAARMSEDQLAVPRLILAPTWWHDNKNELYVFNNRRQPLLRQEKQYPFSLGKHKEDLREPDRTVVVLHIPYLGRMAFPICKDFLIEDYTDMLVKKLRVTFLFCPSYSPSSAQFELGLPAHRPYGCCVIWLNCCSAHNYYSKEHGIPKCVGGIAYPSRGTTPTLFGPQCGGACGDDSAACLFLVKISLDRDHPYVEYDHVCRGGA